MAKNKVKTICDWPELRKIKDIQSFLGFANFYRRFIFNYSDIIIPLTWLTCKGTPWAWTEDCQRSFDYLKTAFTSAPILAHWEPDLPLIVETDASDYALTAILSTITSEGELHPLAFHSRTFTAPELNYDVHEKELLAIFEVFKRWQHYLEGSAEPIDVVTDHKNLECFSTTKVLTRRQARWSEYLSQFNLTIRFCPGKLDTKPDALPSQWDVYLKEGGSDYGTINPQNLWPIFTTTQLVESLRVTQLLIPALRASIIMDSESFHSKILSTLDSDPVAMQHLGDRVKPNPRWTQTDDGFLRLDNQIYVPEANNLRLRVLQYKHDHVLSGHFGQDKMLALIRREYTWTGLRTSVVEF